jgi:hypothetical protein
MFRVKYVQLDKHTVVFKHDTVNPNRIRVHRFLCLSCAEHSPQAYTPEDPPDNIHEPQLSVRILAPGWVYAQALVQVWVGQWHQHHLAQLTLGTIQATNTLEALGRRLPPVMLLLPLGQLLLLPYQFLLLLVQLRCLVHVLQVPLLSLWRQQLLR